MKRVYVVETDEEDVEKYEPSFWEKIMLTKAEMIFTLISSVIIFTYLIGYCAFGITPDEVYAFFRDNVSPGFGSVMHFLYITATQILVLVIGFHEWRKHEVFHRYNFTVVGRPLVMLTVACIKFLLTFILIMFLGVAATVVNFLRMIATLVILAIGKRQLEKEQEKESVVIAEPTE